MKPINKICIPPYTALCIMGVLCFLPMVGVALVNEQMHSSLFNTMALLLLSALLVCMLAAVGGRKFAPWFGAIYQLFLPEVLASGCIQNHVLSNS